MNISVVGWYKNLFLMHVDFYLYQNLIDAIIF